MEDTRFIAMTPRGKGIFNCVTDIVKQGGLIPFDGLSGSHKVYHMTLQPPKEVSLDTARKIVLEKYCMVVSAKIIGVECFGKKVVLILDNDIGFGGGRDPGKPIFEHFQENYESMYPFRPHITIGEAATVTKAEQFLAAYKPFLFVRTSNKVFLMMPDIITKHRGKDRFLAEYLNKHQGDHMVVFS